MDKRWTVENPLIFLASSQTANSAPLRTSCTKSSRYGPNLVSHSTAVKVSPKGTGDRGFWKVHAKWQDKRGCVGKCNWYVPRQSKVFISLEQAPRQVILKPSIRCSCLIGPIMWCFSFTHALSAPVVSHDLRIYVEACCLNQGFSAMHILQTFVEDAISDSEFQEISSLSGIGTRGTLFLPSYTSWNIDVVKTVM